LSPDLRPLPSFPTRRSSDLDNIGAGGAEIAFGNCVRHADRAHAGGARSLDSGRSVFDRQTLTRLERQLAIGAAPHIKQFKPAQVDRKSTRLNSSHQIISYAV